MALSMYVPKSGYRALERYNYYIPSFGYLTFDGATIIPPAEVNLFQFGRGFARALNRGYKS